MQVTVEFMNVQLFNNVYVLVSKKLQWFDLEATN